MKTSSLNLLGAHALVALFVFIRFELALAVLFVAGFLALAVWDCARTIRPLAATAGSRADFAPATAERLPYAA